ncbi:hypothetical protein OOZ51_15515 [Arthrobacter sp. MI7-26]|uniref:hypothetical protein n=1 Tax=Arthrobacter sp. MI7-26 TaxID=2993653 RepID=UPI002248BD6F|nr:hypothetical protein [Arthrobacter sp. MI7-26]MCX2749216.1 hypothetical protein [Arthrobacter sp. MI7-26]
MLGDAKGSADTSGQRHKPAPGLERGHPGSPYSWAVKRVLLDQTIYTDYGQFDLIWSETGGFDRDFARFFAGRVNGLIGASDPDGVFVNLARRSGGSSVRMILLEDPPADNDASWEDVVAVSFIFPDGHSMGWLSWAAEAGDR